MKMINIYVIATLLFALTSQAQIDKGNWMMGGGANFSYVKRTNEGISSESTGFDLRPNVGYFVIDKLAIGASGELSYLINTNNNNFNYGIGPFVRYYFLEKEKPFNIFSGVSYSISKVNNADSKLENFLINAGAVYFLNSSVGLEGTLNYLNQKFTGYEQYNSIYLGVGFQIHLEREK